MIVCACAHPSIDKLFEVERLTLGAIHRPSSFVQVPGGKGLNAARAAASIGADVRAVALVGGHAGAWIEDALSEEGFDARFAWGSHETRSCLSVADVATGELTEFYEEGSPVDPDVWDAFEAEIEEALVDAAWIAISGSIPAGAPESGLATIASSARRSGVRVAIDTRGVFLQNALEAAPDVVKVNAGEAAELLGIEIRNDADAAKATEALRARAGGDGHAAVITLGVEGVVAVDASGRGLRGTLDARGRYPVASGDSFLAGLVATLDRGGTFEEALSNGLGTAAANAEMPGAGRLNAERARALSARARVETI
ncbi:MAG: 1-phosphofructokinase family hexose kinase [Actinomycetota bacterium]